MSLPRKRLKKKVDGTATGPLPRRRRTPAWVKEAADRAEARARGEDIDDEPKVLLDPIPGARDRYIPPPPPSLPVLPPKEVTSSRRPSKKGPNGTLAKLAATYDPEKHPKQAAEMVLNGATDRDLIVAFHINQTVLNMWRTQYPEFAAACQITKAAALADQRVERSVYEMANGYSIPAVKIFVYKGKVIKVPYRKYVQKDINAAKYWLMNRDPTRWGKGAEGGGGGGNELPTSINVNMIRGMTTEQIKQTIQVLQQVVTPNKALSRLDEIKDINNDAEVIEGEFSEVKGDGEE